MKGLINRSFKSLGDASFDSRALHVVNSMTENSHFPLLQDRLPAIKAAEEKFAADLAAAKTLGRLAVAVKNESRKILARLLSSLALLIMAQTDDVVLLVTTGFVLRKKNEPRVVTAPTSIALSAGMNSGEIMSTVSRPKGAQSFLHQICEVVAGSEERAWISTASTSNKHLFSNLQSGKLYAVRCGAVGPKGQLAFSPIAAMYAQ
jgi:hypothetical protein